MVSILALLPHTAFRRNTPRCCARRRASLLAHHLIGCCVGKLSWRSLMRVFWHSRSLRPPLRWKASGRYCTYHCEKTTRCSAISPSTVRRCGRSRDLESRVAKALVQLVESVSLRGIHSPSVELHLSQRELGNMVGRSRESVNKHLQIWHRQGLIDLSKAAIMILDLEAIKRPM